MAAGEGHAVLAPYESLLQREPGTVLADLESFCALLERWQAVQNLVSRETLTQLWPRHIADSLQVLTQLQGGDRLILDLGSGGGFPAIPLAIATKGRDLRFTLVEPNNRKASFLRTVIRTLGLQADVEAQRSTELNPARRGQINVITSRALAPLTELCTLMLPFFGPETRAILHKGREHVDELAEAGALWHYDVVQVPSVTDPEGALLVLRNLLRKTRS